MSETPYKRGMRFQAKVRDLLIKDGYGVAQTGGSRGPADLWAAKAADIPPLTQLLLVSVKRTNGLITRAERVNLLALARLCGGLPIVAYQPIPRRPVQYRRLTGIEPKQWEPFTPDEVA